MADSGRLMKMDVDYSEIVDRRLPELQELAKVREPGDLCLWAK